MSATARRSSPRGFVVAAGALTVVTGLAGCATTLGYAVGSAVDNGRGHYELQGTDARGLADDRVRLRCRDGSEKEGSVLAIQPRAAAGTPPPGTKVTLSSWGDDSVLLLKQSPFGPATAVPLGDISAVEAWRRPASGRIVGAALGAALDVIITVMIVRSSISPQVGSFN